jgi:hypothetical protein
MVAHHAGEELLLTAALAGAGAGSLGLALVRARLAEVRRRLRRAVTEWR